MPRASVLIATRDRADLLDACLTRLRDQTTEDFETVVVDNGSSDATPAVIDAAQRAGMAIRALSVAEPHRGKARNAGIAASQGELVIFCDDDTLPPAGFVDAHLRAASAASNAVVSGPIINVSSAEVLPRPDARHFSRAFLCTCNASVARRQLIAVGGFDERYDLYGWEDTDLGVRLRKAGAHRVWAWDAYIYHVKPPGAVSLERRLAQAAEKGAMAARFVRKSPSIDVRLATGAYAANFVRDRIMRVLGLRRWAEHVVASASPDSSARRAASETLVDAAYLDALRAGLRRPEG